MFKGGRKRQINAPLLFLGSGESSLLTELSPLGQSRPAYSVASADVLLSTRAQTRNVGEEGDLGAIVDSRELVEE